MKNIKYWILPLLIFWARVHVAQAGFEITEIMYDLDGTDTNREWVEVQNTGSDSADLSTWYLFTDNTKHALVPQGAPQVPAGGYAIIAQNVTNFRADQPDFGGLLFDSSWTGLNNDGETIALKDPNQNIISEVSFTSSMGGAGNGDSLQKIGSSWQSAKPTPGAENKAGSGVEDTGDDTSTTTTQAPPKVKKKEIEVPKIITNIVAKNTAVAGLPLDFSATTAGYGKEPLRMGKFVWNFGDGMTKEQQESDPFQYTYMYPGEYVVTLSYYRVYGNKDIDATDRLTIKVIPRDVTISSVGNTNDPFVEIENKSPLEIDLSKWIIQGGIHLFTIPDGTILLPSKKIKFSPRVTIFSGEDLKYVTLFNSKRETLAIYPSSVKSTRYVTPAENNILEPTNDLKPTTPESSVINLDDLGASAEGSPISISTSALAWLGFICLIFVASLMIFILNRRNPSLSKEEKNLTAEDMLIME
jgi:hypothetical protein